MFSGAIVNRLFHNACRMDIQGESRRKVRDLAKTGCPAQGLRVQVPLLNG